MRAGSAFRRELLLRLLGTIGAASCGTRTGLLDAVDAAAPVDAGLDTGVSLPVDASPEEASVGDADAGSLSDAALCEVDASSVRDGGDAATIHLVCVPADGTCLSPSRVLAGGYSQDLCGEPAITEVFCGPVPEGSRCCYEVEQDGPLYGCYVGRAFLADEGLVKAELSRGAGWRTGEPPRADRISTATRRALSAAWVMDGLFEHASVASFARLSMQLLAAGAPADLLRDTHAAAIDEVRHAELCFALASAYADEDLAPSSLPVPDAVAITKDLEEIVAESVVEGCIGETLAAAQAAESLARATDPAVVAALEDTLKDEIRHAELAWRIVAWAIGRGGERVRRKVARTFANFVPPAAPKRDMEGVCAALFAAHGRLTADEARDTALRALREVVVPCSCALLAAGA